MQDNFNNEKEFLDNNSNQNFRLAKSQKIMAVLLAFFALFVIVLWSVQFKQTLTEPFIYKGEDTTANGSDAAGGQSAAELQSKDTDGDGLSDYDELNLYNTSPYLEDSDSDGILDKAEIDKGTDPNCPTGQNCFSSEQTAPSASQAQATSSLNILNQGNASEQQLSAEESEMLKSVVGENMDAASLRALLIEQGMDKAMLDQVSDADLMKSFEEILKE